MAQMKSFDVVDFVKRFLTFSLKDGSKKDALGYKAILNTGFDLRAPVEVSLLLMFKNERDALAAKLEVEIDFDVKIITNDDETILLIQKSIILTEAKMAQLRKQMEGMAKKFKGKYDGWEVKLAKD